MGCGGGARGGAVIRMQCKKAASAHDIDTHNSSLKDVGSGGHTRNALTKAQKDLCIQPSAIAESQQKCLLLYSGKFLREKISVNFADRLIFAQIFPTNILLYYVALC